MAKGKGKGSSFERDVAKQLSAWLTRGENPDCLWRSAMSGGKATVTGSAVGTGDLVAVHPDGHPLIERVCFELKRGYPAADWYSIVESNKPAKPIVDFIKQAKDSASLGACPMWSIIHKRDRKRPMVYFDGGFHEDLEGLLLNSVGYHNRAVMILELFNQSTGIHVCGTTLEAFLQINPDSFLDRVDHNTIIGDF